MTRLRTRAERGKEEKKKRKRKKKEAMLMRSKDSREQSSKETSWYKRLRSEKDQRRVRRVCSSWDREVHAWEGSSFLFVCSFVLLFWSSEALTALWNSVIDGHVCVPGADADALFVAAIALLPKGTATLPLSSVYEKYCIFGFDAFNPQGIVKDMEWNLRADAAMGKELDNGVLQPPPCARWRGFSFSLTQKWRENGYL